MFTEFYDSQNIPSPPYPHAKKTLLIIWGKKSIIEMSIKIGHPCRILVKTRKNYNLVKYFNFDCQIQNGKSPSSGKRHHRVF